VYVAGDTLAPIEHIENAGHVGARGKVILLAFITEALTEAPEEVRLGDGQPLKFEMTPLARNRRALELLFELGDLLLQEVDGKKLLHAHA
jgi:hypothetical protein